MSSPQLPQPTISVEEIHTYDVTVGNESDIRWDESGSEIKVSVVVPYDDELTYGGQHLIDLESPGARLNLGAVVFKSPEGGHEAARVPVHLPAGSDLKERIKKGEQLVQKWAYPALKPDQHLVSLEGEVFDGADADDWRRLLAFRDDESMGGMFSESLASDPSPQLLKLLSDEEQVGDFANNLRLRLKLWVPNLFQRTLGAQYHELLSALGEQDRRDQVVLPASALSDSESIGRHMVALANTAGGGRLIIVARDGEEKVVPLPAGYKEDDLSKRNTARQNIVSEALLRALVRCTPAVPIASLTYYRDGNNEIVAAQVTLLPQGHDGQGRALWQRLPSWLGGDGAPHYRFEGQVYVRKSNATVERRVRLARPARRHALLGLSPRRLQDVLNGGSTDDVIVLDARRDAHTLSLGRHICGLVNGSQHGGLIVIHNLPFDLQLLPMQLPMGLGIVPKLNEQLERELERCQPRPVVSKFWLTRFEREYVAVLRVEPGSVPISLYQAAPGTAPEAYRWDERALKAIDQKSLFTTYMLRMGASASQVADDRPQISYAELKWPIQPPLAYFHDDTRSVYEAEARSGNDGVYDVQRQALVWGGARKEKPKVSRQHNGMVCNLDASLRSGLAPVGAGATPTGQPTHTGKLVVRFEQVLASGLVVTAEADNKALWFGKLPIKRTTKLVLNVKVHTDQLFIRRRKMSLSHFYVPDTLLDAARLNDICEALADLGFRINPPYLDGQGRFAWVTGVRTKGFHDITLFGYIPCAPRRVLRQLRYEQRSDTKGAATAQLDCRIVLHSQSSQEATQPAGQQPWGAVPPVSQPAKEMNDLHIAIHEVLNERLRYLRAE